MTSILILPALLTPLMAFLSRTSGSGDRGFGSLWSGWSGLPELAYGAVFGLAGYVLTGNAWFAVIAGIVSWRAMEMGHGTFYDMVGWRGADGPPAYGSTEKPRMQGLDYLLLPLFKTPRQPLYSYIAMFIKGTLIAAPLLWFAPLNGVLFAATYGVTRHYCPNKPKLAEWVAGACAGCVISFAITTVR